MLKHGGGAARGASPLQKPGFYENAGFHRRFGKKPGFFEQRALGPEVAFLTILRKSCYLLPSAFCLLHPRPLVTSRPLLDGPSVGTISGSPVLLLSCYYGTFTRVYRPHFFAVGSDSLIVRLGFSMASIVRWRAIYQLALGSGRSTAIRCSRCGLKSATSAGILPARYEPFC